MPDLHTPENQRRMELVCYNDNLGYGWKHVDLFTHDLEGNELNWVHWKVDEDGPEAADRSTAQVEPTLKRVSAWAHRLSSAGQDYWVAEVVWSEI